MAPITIASEQLTIFKVFFSSKQPGLNEAEFESTGDIWGRSGH